MITQRFSLNKDIQKEQIIYQLDDNEFVNEFQYNMLINNEIRGILPINRLSINGEKQLVWDVSTLISLKDYIEIKKDKGACIINLLRAVVEILKQCENYLLDEESVVLTLDEIYVNNQTEKINVIYLPLNQGKTEKQGIFYDRFREFIERLILYIGVDDQEALAILHQIFKLTREREFNIKKLIQILEQDNSKSKEPPKPVSYGESEIQFNSTERVIKENIEEVSKIKKNDVAKPHKKQTERIKLPKTNKKIIIILLQIGLTIIFLGMVCLNIISFSKIETIIGVLLIMGCIDFIILRKINEIYVGNQSKHQEQEKTVRGIKSVNQIKNKFDKSSELNKTELLDCNKTEILVQQPSNMTYLIYKESGEKILLEKFPYLIGKDESRVQMLIENNTVSRVHAEILSEGLEHYIIDLNSKNGTFLNGYKLESNKRYLLNQEDEIRFSNQVYVWSK